MAASRPGSSSCARWGGVAGRSGGPRRGVAVAPRLGSTLRDGAAAAHGEAERLRRVPGSLTLVAAVVPALAVEARGDRCGPGRRCGGVGGAAELEAQAGWRCCDGEAAWRCRDGESLSQGACGGGGKNYACGGRNDEFAVDPRTHR
ncbi:hypothetical protein PVAP13_2KG197900 [Panicum virgatum]|uniref:Uncharacterized protein n=1 Tax=Panicum virgatum TaxID=38727 RepID=A0A8T0W499_PANVG|nr:hypothetical protein PVAP13_2KG197900 [Panicum virgatum]